MRTALINALTETDASVRQAAADALAAQADPAAVPALLKAMNDPDSSVRAAAAHALGVAESQRGRAPADRHARRSRRRGRRRRRQRPGRTGRSRRARHADQRRDGPRHSRAALRRRRQRARQNPGPARRPDPRQTPRSPKENVRWASADALGGLGVADAVKPLAAVALKDQNPQIREAALAALSNIGDPSALDTLVNALSDKEKRVADQALRSLIQVADSNPSLYDCRARPARGRAQLRPGQDRPRRRRDATRRQPEQRRGRRGACASAWPPASWPPKNGPAPGLSSKPSSRNRPRNPSTSNPWSPASPPRRTMTRYWPAPPDAQGRARACGLLLAGNRPRRRADRRQRREESHRRRERPREGQPRPGRRRHRRQTARPARQSRPENPPRPPPLPHPPRLPAPVSNPAPASSSAPAVALRFGSRVV